MVAFEAMLCGMLFVMYGGSVFSSVFAITERSEMGLVRMMYICSCLCLVLNWYDAC